MTTIATSFFIFFGALFLLISAIGLLRFPDLNTRLHATTKATSFGVLLIIIAVAIFFNTGISWLKAVLVIVFIYFTAPLAAHSIAKSVEKKKK